MDRIDIKPGHTYAPAITHAVALGAPSAPKRKVRAVTDGAVRWSRWNSRKRCPRDGQLGILEFGTTRLESFARWASSDVSQLSELCDHTSDPIASLADRLECAERMQWADNLNPATRGALTALAQVLNYQECEGGWQEIDERCAAIECVEPLSAWDVQVAEDLDMFAMELEIAGAEREQERELAR